MTSPADYTSWSQADLIQRVSELERQLRANNDQHKLSNDATASLANLIPPRKKQRKAPKQFDPSRYTTRLIALKFAYLGGNYNGFEHHANNITPLPTIEEEVWRALHKTRLIFPTHKPGQSEDEVTWDGCEYSKCGRTDRGVSAFGQVIGIRVRSNRPKSIEPATRESNAGRAENGTEVGPVSQEAVDSEESDVRPVETSPPFDDIRDEIPYVQLLNKVLPPDIRMLAWCARPPPEFSARFDCRERRYRYFFTNPAFCPVSAQKSELGKPPYGQVMDGWLNIETMESAAKRYEGLHDFRNFCKIDPSKQITNFERRIFHAGIHRVRRDSVESSASSTTSVGMATPELYYFEVRGSAFLWHQVRHLVAVLFLVGQGFETPDVVDKLLDVSQTPGKPLYEMASDVPLVLWDCIFPGRDEAAKSDYATNATTVAPNFENAMQWTYPDNTNQGTQGRNVLLDDLWALWRKRRIDEVLAWGLMDAIVMQNNRSRTNSSSSRSASAERSDRVFDGGEASRTVGKYVPVAQRACMEMPDVVNARYAARKGATRDSRSSTPEPTS